MQEKTNKEICKDIQPSTKWMGGNYLGMNEKGDLANGILNVPGWDKATETTHLSDGPTVKCNGVKIIDKHR